MKEGVRPFIMHLFCGLECEFPGEGGYISDEWSVILQF